MPKQVQRSLTVAAPVERAWEAAVDLPGRAARSERVGSAGALLSRFMRRGFERDVDVTKDPAAIKSQAESARG